MVVVEVTDTAVSWVVDRAAVDVYTVVVETVVMGIVVGDIVEEDQLDEVIVRGLLMVEMVLIHIIDLVVEGNSFLH